MKRLLFSLAVLLAAACSPESRIDLLPASAFTAVRDGRPVSLYTLRSDGVTMQVTNYGARVVTLWTPDRRGRYDDIVLGYETLDRYLHNYGERFLGAVIGPCANRIGGGRFTLDGEEYRLPQNDGEQTLHGGKFGLDRVVWEVLSATGNQLVMHYLHRDGEEGFPGNLDITLTYTLAPGNVFFITWQAMTDRPTVVNLSHHSFFNLKGEGRGTILDNELTIPASRITPVDERLVPTGELADVTGTPFDFREPHAIGERIGADDGQLRNGKGYDMNWVLDREGREPAELVLAARVYEPTTGRTLELWSDQPGVQFYSGNFFDGKTKGKYGRPLRFRESLALESQHFPDSPNRPEFPSVVLRPGETYVHTCYYRFGAEER